MINNLITFVKNKDIQEIEPEQTITIPLGSTETIRLYNPEKKLIATQTTNLFTYTPTNKDILGIYEIRYRTNIEAFVLRKKIPVGEISLEDYQIWANAPEMAQSQMLIFYDFIYYNKMYILERGLGGKQE
ncbi:MAG: hypothetical protein AB1630_09585 [bacterium]